MTRAKCVERIKRGGRINYYAIQFENGEIKEVESNTLKNLIRNKNITVCNLTLTSDNRLLPKEDKREDINKEYLAKEIVYIMNMMKKNKAIEAGLCDKVAKNLSLLTHTKCHKINSDTYYFGCTNFSVFLYDYGDIRLTLNGISHNWNTANEILKFAEKIQKINNNYNNFDIMKIIYPIKNQLTNVIKTDVDINTDGDTIQLFIINPKYTESFRYDKATSINIILEKKPFITIINDLGTSQTYALSTEHILDMYNFIYNSYINKQALNKEY